MDLQYAFAEAMRAHGLVIDSGKITANKKWQRFNPDGNPQGKPTAYYRLHPDPPASGFFGDWKTGFSTSWCSKQALTPEEKRTLKKRIQADNKAKQREEEKRHAEAKRKANYLWPTFAECPETHGYIARKQIKTHGARVSKGRVVVPVQRGPELVGLQFIPEVGDKKFLAGTPVKGSYFLIGPEPKDIVCICEGYATGASIHEVMGWPVVVAFNDSNLVPVALHWRELNRDLRILVAADNDQWTEKPIQNPGLHYARLAAGQTRGEVRVPEFKPGFAGKPTDFNDIATLYGPGEVKLQLEKTPLELPEELDQNETLQVGFPDAIFYPLLPHQDPGKKPKATIQNLFEILKRIGAVYRYNVIRKKQEIEIKGRGYSMDNHDNAVLADVQDACARFEYPTDRLNSYLNKLCDLNQFNPVKQWVQQKPWDGTSRLEAFYETVTARGELEIIDPDDANKTTVGQLKQIVMRRWLVSAIAAAFEPFGVSAHGVLVMQGFQGIGKTLWFKNLLPQDMKLTMDGAILNLHDKDSIYIVLQHWLVELGELDATIKRSDFTQLKAFFGRDKDIIRLPYDQRPSTFPRRTVFFASVNPNEFLHDETGNRRYWTIQCEEIDHSHTLDMQQVWAEAFELYANGEGWHLTRLENYLLETHNEQFQARDPIEEQIKSFYDWSEEKPSRKEAEELADNYFKTSTQVCHAIGIAQPSKTETNRAAAIVRKLNGGIDRKRNYGKLLWVPRERPGHKFPFAERV